MASDTPKTRKEVFKILREFFEDDNIDVCEHDAVWDVLTALRGPDDKDIDKKMATTAVIRDHVFGPNLAYRICATFNEDNASHVKWRVEKTHFSNHFSNHAQRAFAALGLSWDSVNE